MWINELLTKYEKRCYNMFRMNQNAFHHLGDKYGLKSLDRMSILEKSGFILVYP